MDNTERRRYFRVDVEMILSYKPISQEEMQKNSLLLNTSSVEHPDSHKLFITLESDLQEAIARLPKNQAEIANIVTLLNRKLNLLSQGGPVPSTQETIMDLPPQMVNLSACGLAFKSAHPVNLGEAIEFELVLLPEQAYIMGYGMVISCEQKPLSPTHDGPSKHPYRVGIDFKALRDDDMERIIQHIMRKEAEILKARRHLQS